MNPLSRVLCASAALLIGGCGQMAQSLYLASYNRDIRNAAHEIETARDDPHRAEAYAKRGSAYSEKARYSRAFKLISPDEYNRLFGLAIKDHNQAVALDPASAEALHSWADLLRPGCARGSRQWKFGWRR